jgi:hypothetical protein
MSGNLDQIKSIVGLFISTLPVKTVVKLQESLTSFAGQLQEHQLQAREYEHIGLGKILQWSDVQSQRLAI